MALNQIRESFSLSQADASLWLAITYMGALPAMVVARRADVIGRKRLLLVSIVFYTLASGLTALSPNVGVFALPAEASVFALDFLQEARGFDASSASLALVVAGTPGIPLMVWSGNASDRFGRRIVGSSFMLLSVVGGALFFWVDAPGPVPIFFMVLLTSGAMGGWPILQGMVTELFPTAVRSQATSVATGFRITGQAASLLLGGLLLHALDDNFPMTVTILSGGVVLAVVVVVFLLPDTHSAELEALTGEEAFEWDAPATAVAPLVTER